MQSRHVIKQTVLATLCAAVIVGCGNGSSGASNQHQQPNTTNAMISLYDPARQVSKVVVVDATDKVLYTGSIAQHSSSALINVDLPLVLHDHSEWVKLYDNKNVLISVGQVGGFIESNGASFEMDNNLNLTALGLYLVGKTIDASSNLAKDPMSALAALAKNYEASDTSDPYTMLGAKFVLLQQNGKSESEAVNEVISMLDQYDQLVTPLPLDDKIIKIIEDANNPNTNSGTNSKPQATTFNNSKLIDNNNKSIDYATLLTSRTKCYKEKSYNVSDSDMAFCVRQKIIEMDSKYYSQEYANDLKKVTNNSNSFGALASTGTLHVLSDAKTVATVAGKVANVTGLRCSLKQDDVSTMSTVFGGLDQVLSLAPAPVNLIGSLSSGVFDGVCPTKITRKNSVTVSLEEIQDSLKRMDGKLDALSKAIEDNANKMERKLNDSQMTNAYVAYQEIYTEKYLNPLAEIEKNVKSYTKEIDSTSLDPNAPYQLAEADFLKPGEVRSNLAFSTLLKNYHALVTSSSANQNNLLISLDNALATCQQAAITKSTVDSDFSLDTGLSHCLSIYSKHLSKIHMIATKQYIIGSNIKNAINYIESQSDQIIESYPQDKMTPAEKEPTNYKKMLNLNTNKLGKNLLTLRWEILGSTFGIMDDERNTSRKVTGILKDYQTDYLATNLKNRLELFDGEITKYVTKVANGSDQLANSLYYASSMDYLYRKANSQQRTTLQAIANIPTCSTIYNGPTRAKTVNIVDYSIKTNMVTVKCGEDLITYKLDGSALLSYGVHVDDYAEVTAAPISIGGGNLIYYSSSSVYGSPNYNNNNNFSNTVYGSPNYNNKNDYLYNSYYYPVAYREVEVDGEIVMEPVYNHNIYYAY